MFHFDVHKMLTKAHPHTPTYTHPHTHIHLLFYYTLSMWLLNQSVTFFSFSLSQSIFIFIVSSACWMARWPDLASLEFFERKDWIWKCHKIKGRNVKACVKWHLEPTPLKSSPLITFSTKSLGQDSPSVHLFSKTIGSRFTTVKIK